MDDETDLGRIVATWSRLIQGFSVLFVLKTFITVSGPFGWPCTAADTARPVRAFSATALIPATICRFLPVFAVGAVSTEVNAPAAGAGRSTVEPSAPP